MPNDEGMTNAEPRIAGAWALSRGPFGIRAWSFLRHWAFVIRHSHYAAIRDDRFSIPSVFRTPSQPSMLIDRTDSRTFTFDAPALRFSKMIGVSPIRAPAWWQRNSTSCWNEYPRDRT